mgnify:CR=1 FL=1
MGTICNSEKKPISGAQTRYNSVAMPSTSEMSKSTQLAPVPGVQANLIKAPTIETGPRENEEMDNSIANFTLQIPNHQLSKLNLSSMNLPSRIDQNGTINVSVQQLKFYAQDDDDLLNLIRNLGLNAMDPKTKVSINLLPPEPNDLNQSVGQYVKAQLKKVSHPKTEKTDEDSFRLLDTLFHLEKTVPSEFNEFLSHSSVVNDRGYIAAIWNPEAHEISFTREKILGILGEEGAIQFLQSCAAEANYTLDPNIRGGRCILFEPGTRDLAAFDVQAFDSNHLLALTLSIANYDVINNTHILRRLIYPHVGGTPANNPINTAIVKLHVNGCKRAFPVQSDFQKPFTKYQEHFPAVLNKALGMIYPEMGNIVICDVLYRMISWIPEKLLISDAGDLDTSFQRLKESFSNGSFLLFVNDRRSQKVRPILDLRYESNGKENKSMVMTTSSTGLKAIAWQDLISICNTDYIYINWNPTIYDYRKTVHLKTNVILPEVKDPSLAVFNTHYKAQLLLSLEPHSKETEVRILIEKHKKPKDIKYNLSFYLANYEENRVSYMKQHLRTISINETHEEILADLIVFDKTEITQNLVIVINLDPIDKSVLQTLPKDYFEKFSVTVFSFFDFELIQMPYRSILQSQCVEIPFSGEARIIDSRTSIYSVSNHLMNGYPCQRLQVFVPGLFEFRIVGNPNYTYSVYIFKAQGFKASITNTSAVKKSEGGQGISCFNAKLEENTYFIRIVIQNKPKDIKDSLAGITPHKIKLQVLAFGKSLLKGWDAAPQTQTQNSFAMEAYDMSNLVLKQKQSIKGVWNNQTNYGIQKVKVDTYQHFFKNPGLIFTLQEETELAIRLLTNWNPANGEPQFSICLLEILDDYSFRYLIEDGDYVTKEEILSETLVLKANKNGFMALVLNSTKVEAKFQLELISNKPITQIRDNHIIAPEFAFQEKFFGENQRKSGGHSDAPTFLFNSAVSLKIQGQPNEEVTIYITLKFDNSKEPVSLYLIKSSKVSLLTLSEEELNRSEFVPGFLLETHSMYRRVRPGQYILTPSTLKPLENPTPFEMTIYSTAKIFLSKIEHPIYNGVLSTTFPQTSKGTMRLKAKVQTSMLVEIVVDRKTVKLEVVYHNQTENETVLNTSGSDFRFRALFKVMNPALPAIISFRDMWDMNSNYTVTIFPLTPNSLELIA